MSTLAGILVPDYAGSLATGLTGTIATGASTGVIQLGKYRLFQVSFLISGAPAVPSSNVLALRFTLGISTGTTAPTPTAASPMFINYHETIYELNAAYDQINLANLSTDNGALTLNYSLLPLAKF